MVARITTRSSLLGTCLSSTNKPLLRGVIDLNEVMSRATAACATAASANSFSQIVSAVELAFLGTSAFGAAFFVAIWSLLNEMNKMLELRNNFATSAQQKRGAFDQMLFCNYS